jgi:hypothetical protein
VPRPTPPGSDVSLMHVVDDKNRLRFVNPTQINQLELNPVINKKSEMFKGLGNKRWAATIKKAQQKLTKEKSDFASTHIGQLIQRFKDRECIMPPYNFEEVCSIVLSIILDELYH